MITKYKPTKFKEWNKMKNIDRRRKIQRGKQKEKEIDLRG
jgi:hypothetical protein